MGERTTMINDDYTWMVTNTLWTATYDEASIVASSLGTVQSLRMV